MMVGPVHELVAGASQLATTAAAAALWQGVLLAGAAAIGVRLLPQTPAPVRFAIWFAVFLLVAGLPFATVWVGHGSGASGTTGSHPWLTLDARWCVWIAAVWAVASLVRAVTLTAAAVRVRSLWKRAVPIDVAVPQGLARGAQVCVSDEVDRPTVIGFFAPKIVIPEWLISKLSPEELEHVVLHEAGHLSRRDDWVNLLQKLALVLFPLNPALSWVERRLCFERELACDERVLRATGAPKAYAECLATLAEYRLQRRGLVRELALALGALGRESELAQRVLRILSGGGRMKKSHARLVFGGSMLTLVFAASAMERSPQVVGFTHDVAAGDMGAAQVAGVRAIAVTASVGPVDGWKTVGDAAPHLAKRMVDRTRAVELTSAAKAAVPYRAVYGTAEAVPLSKTDAVARQASAAEAVRKTDVVARRVDVVAAQRGNTGVLPLRVAQGQDDNFEESGRGGMAPEVVQTVATARQVTADGRVWVTRMVVVRAYDISAADAGRSVSDVPMAEAQPVGTVQQQSKQQQVRPYAAVPVQGGWLVFQL